MTRVAVAKPKTAPPAGARAGTRAGTGGADARRLCAIGRRKAWRAARDVVAGVAAIALLAALSAPARAQTAPQEGPSAAPPPGASGGSPTGDAGPPRRDISPEAFKAMTDGKTLYFELVDGQLWGREFYVPGSNRTVFKNALTDECLEGHYTREGDRFCYHYRDQPSCWLTFYEDDQIVVEAEDGQRQWVRKIVSNEPLSCADGLLSEARPAERPALQAASAARVAQARGGAPATSP